MSSTETSTWDPIVRVAAAIAAGIGVLGFVALAGGAVLWVRFEAAGLPTEHALSVVPRTELVVIGAETLVPLVVLVLLGVALIWLFVAGIVVATRALPETDARTARAARIKAVAWRVRAAMVVCGIGVFVYYLVYAPATDARDIIFALAVAALAVVITERSWTVLCDESFGLFALVVGVVIVAVGLSVTYLETIERPSVRPAAVAFNDSRRGIAGLFIAESSTTIYIAEVEPKTDNHDEGDEPTGRMIEIPRDRIRALTIGSSQSLPQAITRAPTLLTELNVLVPKK